VLHRGNTEELIWKRAPTVLYRGNTEELIWKSPTEVDVPSVERCQHGAITELCRDSSAEFVVTEFKHSKGWCTDTKHSWYRPDKAIIAGIESDQTLHRLPCGRWKMSCKKVA